MAAPSFEIALLDLRMESWFPLYRASRLTGADGCCFVANIEDGDVGGTKQICTADDEPTYTDKSKRYAETCYGTKRKRAGHGYKSGAEQSNERCAGKCSQRNQCADRLPNSSSPFFHAMRSATSFGNALPE